MELNTKEELMEFLKAQDDKIAQLQESINSANSVVEEEPKDELNSDEAKDTQKEDDTPDLEELDEITEMLNL